MKKWILNWLGLSPKGASTYADSPSLASNQHNILPHIQSRKMFEIISAVNGKILTFNEHKMNPNGPDINNMTVYLIHEGDDIMEVINRAMVRAALK